MTSDGRSTRKGDRRRGVTYLEPRNRPYNIGDQGVWSKKQIVTDMGKHEAQTTTTSPWGESHELITDGTPEHDLRPSLCRGKLPASARGHLSPVVAKDIACPFRGQHMGPILPPTMTNMTKSSACGDEASAADSRGMR